MMLLPRLVEFSLTVTLTAAMLNQSHRNDARSRCQRIRSKSQDTSSNSLKKQE